MSTRWRKNASSFLFIIVLFILLISVWIGVRNGLFSNSSTNPLNKIDVNTEKSKTINDQYGQTNAVNQIDQDNNSSSIRPLSRDDIEYPSSRPPDIEMPPPNGIDSDATINEELVKPTKIASPLNTADLLYESEKSDPGTGNTGKVPDHQITGQYRNISARIWDPHPQYLIDAFGQHIHLVLNQDGNFISENIKITHMWRNETLRKKDDHKDHDKLKGCYYTGRVRGDDHSSVAVSLCDGMRGHIYTSSGSYFIQPIDDYTIENQNILHKISRENLLPKHINLQDDIAVKESACETCDNKDCGPTNIDDITLSNDYNGLGNDSSNHHRNKRNTSPNVIVNNAYTMEVLVAVDKKMQDYHGHHLRGYVLTLMSIVSSIYADASIGNSINVAVVHILLLKDDLHVESNSVGVSATKMLSTFCSFVQKHQFHHDTALLLTREQICRNNNQKKCDTLGLAQLGTMCQPSSCAIVQDNGLSAAFTMAHELGHVLNMPHDDDTKCAQFRKPNTKQNIMSKMLDHNTHPWSWSECSRHFVTEFLESNHGYCMLNKPIHDMIDSQSLIQTLAGEKFSANRQCELVFGSGSKVCSYMKSCSSLWCGNDIEGCRTQHMPWADGTECGINQWCQHGQCVYRDRSALVKIDGGWGPWKPYDQCARPCGGGVHSSTRDCNSPSPANGGQYCIGNRIKYKSCNTHDCPPDTLDFREEQCAELNNNNFDIPGIDKDVKWVPKYGVSSSPLDECKLYCRVDKSSIYFVLKDKVKDGTSCTHDSFNKCVNGICRAAGCDNELSSTAVLDKCGVCNGNNDTCIDIYGSISPKQVQETRTQTPYYFFVTKIPRGSSNIQIIQEGFNEDLNYIALIDDHGDYILNGYNVITQYPRTFPYGGVTFEYTGTNATIEMVNTTFARRLKRDLTVEILSRTDRYINRDLMTYSYTVALNEHSSNFYPYNRHNQYDIYQSSHHTSRLPATPEPPPPVPIIEYHWEMSEWSECDKICQGQRFRTAVCLKVHGPLKVSPSYCRDQKPLDEYEVCNENCEISWEINRSECSNPCGEGVRTITHNCIQKFPKQEHSNIVDNAYCPTTNKPNTYEKCRGPCRMATWSYGEWGPCSRTCGGGSQSRKASCLSHPGGYPIDEAFCLHLLKDEIIRSCNQEECPLWSYGDISQCSVTCGEGVRVTKAYCKHNNQIVNQALCTSLARPSDRVSNCTMEPCHRKVIPTILFAGDQPTARSINVYRDFQSTTSFTPISSHSTSNQHSNPSIIYTAGFPSILSSNNKKYKWRTSRWGHCSVTCGHGVKSRSVRCSSASSSAHELVDDRYCGDDKPVNTTNCEEQRCPEWNYSAWGECNSYCKRERQVICQDSQKEIDKRFCPADKQPPSLEQCCHFRWRNTWTQCSATCGDGYRKRQRVCMKLYPRSTGNPMPRKKGQTVDYIYCSNMTVPIFVPKVKKCRKQCDTPKWSMSAWSKCSVGCGRGYMAREVKCMNGKQLMSDSACSGIKPSKTSHCENRNECEWKLGKWKQCSCGGYRKRRVQCYDIKLNKLSNSCSERDKPIQRERCRQPSNCSCKTLQQQEGIRKDGEYDINVRGRSAKIYCHNMKAPNPQEYLSLRSDANENYSSYYNRRSTDSQQCPRTRNGEWDDASIPSGITYFSKIKINLHTLQVIEDDFEFARVTGRKPQPYGSAGDCYSTTERCPQGDFAINIEGTGFKIKSHTKWDKWGQNATILFRKKLEPPYQKVMAICGGYCGRCFPSKNTTLQLEFL